MTLHVEVGFIILLCVACHTSEPILFNSIRKCTVFCTTTETPSKLCTTFRWSLHSMIARVSHVCTVHLVSQINSRSGTRKSIRSNGFLPGSQHLFIVSSLRRFR